MYTGWLLVTIPFKPRCEVILFYQTEMRFYVPNSNADDDEDDGSRKTVEVLHAEIMKHVVIEATGAQVRHSCKLLVWTYSLKKQSADCQARGNQVQVSSKYFRDYIT